MEIFNINHSLKDIPIPPTDYYTKCLIDRTEEFIGRIRWAAFHFLNPNDKTSKKPPLETFGFRTNVAPPQIKELAPFEHELYELIANIKFRDKRSYTSHQRELTRIAREINKSDKIFLLGDKTTNVYKVSPELYNKMLLDNVTKDYRIAEPETVHDINIEAKIITEELKIADRVEAHSESPAFISLKDHKTDFRTNPRCRLINPAKSQIGNISKTILQNLNKSVREATGQEQWQSTKQVLQWFTNIDQKKDRYFLQFDIVDFYPSITVDLLNKALKFTEEQGFPLTKQQKDIVMNARKSLLFARRKPDGAHVPWQKTENSDFDVTMGAPDGAEVCELVGLFILNELKRRIPEVNFGLYRDDGLGEHQKMPSKDIDK